MIDSIYYTSNLVPVPVEVIERSGLLATVKTQTNKLFKVPEHRIIPMKSTASIGTGVIRTKPAGYLCIYEFLWNNDIRDLSQEEASLISRRAGWACRKAEIKSWRGKQSVVYYPARIIESCYQKFRNEKNS